MAQKAKRGSVSPSSSKRTLNQAAIRNQKRRRAPFITKRENWGNKGFLNVTRQRGRLVFIEKWSKSRPTHSSLDRKVAQKATLTSSNPTYSRISRKDKRIKAVYKTPLQGEIGQVYAIYKVRCRVDEQGKAYTIEGMSYLDDCSNHTRFKKQLRDTEYSAMSAAPCYLGESSKVSTDFEGTAQLMPDSIRFIYYLPK